MAGRQLQRVLKDRLEEGDDSVASTHSEASDSGDEPAFNPFSLLEESEDDPVGWSDSDGEGERSLVSSKGPTVPVSGRRRKGRGKKMVHDRVTSDEEDIDQVLKELAIENPATDEPSQAEEVGSQEAAVCYGTVFKINRSHLKAADELRKIFGSEVTRHVFASESGREGGNAALLQGGSRRVRRLAARGLIRRQELKRGILIDPRDTWPHLPSSDILKLSLTGEVYSYEASSSYESVQQAYEQAQASLNPRNLMGLMQSHPYHIDGLLTMSDLYRSTGETAYADEMLEMCVYALERGWPQSLFHTLETRGVQIPYKGPYNKSLFIALMRYVQILGRRGLFRTGLECCKLILSLNRDDPCGALLAIDYYALRYKEYEFVKNLAETYDHGAVATMPNIVYSVALAQYYIDGLPSQEADDLLAKAMMLHPAVMVSMQNKLEELKLVQASGSMIDDWQQVLHSEPFVSSHRSLEQSPPLQKLVDIFVERQHLLWKSAPIQSFLLRAAERVAGLASASEDMQRDGLPFGLTIDDWSSMRQQAFPEEDSNSYAHLRIADFSDTVAQLPPEEVQGALDGPDETDIGQMDPQQVEQLMQALSEAGDTPNLDEGALLGFLRSLLPWVNAGQQPDYSNDDLSDDGHAHPDQE